MNKICIFFLLVSLFLSSNPAFSVDFNERDRTEYESLFRDALLFYQQGFRHGPSGQYYDDRVLNPRMAMDDTSSVAATGMGLVSLALADRAGIQKNAREDALRTLRFALGQGRLNGRPYPSYRSRTGWFRHWFDINSGENNEASRADGFSTIDTTILVAGAQLAASYFEASGKDRDGQLRALADALLHSVKWDSAISNLDTGALYLNFDLATQAPKASTAVFNEYILVACLGARAEGVKRQPGLMTEFWRRHYASAKNLPRKSYEGIELLTDHPDHFLSSFTMQFAAYLCGSVSGSAEYMEYFSRSQKADRLWFSKVPGSRHFWGLGAGETRVRYENGTEESYYSADAINRNVDLMVSPHIIAGFLPVYPEGMRDLLAMARANECVYAFGKRRFLWRCSLKHLSMPMERVQAIDFSSMFLGLSAFHPEIGFDFFRAHAPMAK